MNLEQLRGIVKFTICKHSKSSRPVLVHYCKCNCAIFIWRSGSYYTCSPCSGVITFMFYKDKYARVKILILHPIVDVWCMIESGRLVSLTQCSNWLMPFKKRQIPVFHRNRVPGHTQCNGGFLMSTIIWVTLILIIMHELQVFEFLHHHLPFFPSAFVFRHVSIFVFRAWSLQKAARPKCILKVKTVHSICHFVPHFCCIQIQVRLGWKLELI